MGVPRISTGPMTVDEFAAFTDTRPDEEKWELIDGEPVLNASPSDYHQWIVSNLIAWFDFLDRQKPKFWKAIAGIGLKLSEIQRPEPDVMIYPKSSLGKAKDRDDVIIAFEVMSLSTTARDLRWKRAAYTGLPSLTHYVVVAQDVVDVVVFAREDGFSERRYHELSEVIELPALGVSLPVSEIYRETGIG